MQPLKYFCTFTFTKPYMYLQQKNSHTTYSGVVRFFSYKQMLAREREQIKENVLVTNEDERGYYMNNSGHYGYYQILYKLIIPF
jgi:hypothetical protein